MKLLISVAALLTGAVVSFGQGVSVRSFNGVSTNLHAYGVTVLTSSAPGVVIGELRNTSVLLKQPADAAQVLITVASSNIPSATLTGNRSFFLLQNNVGLQMTRIDTNGITTQGIYSGDGSGLTNLNLSAFTNAFFGSIILSNNPTSQDFNTTPSTVTNWTRAGPSLGVTANTNLGTLTVANAGTYFVIAKVDSDAGSAAEGIGELYVNANPTGLRFHRDITVASAHGSAGMFGTLVLAANDVLSLRLSYAANETIGIEEGQFVVMTFGGGTNAGGGSTAIEDLTGTLFSTVASNAIVLIVYSNTLANWATNLAVNTNNLAHNIPVANNNAQLIFDWLDNGIWGGTNRFNADTYLLGSSNYVSGLAVFDAAVTINGQLTVDAVTAMDNIAITAGNQLNGSIAGATNLPLSGVAQSGATGGQIPMWSGTAWMPTNPAAGSQTPWTAPIDGGNFPLTDVQQISIGFPTMGSSNVFQVFGTNKAFPSFEINNTNGSVTFRPGAGGSATATLNTIGSASFRDVNTTLGVAAGSTLQSGATSSIGASGRSKFTSPMDGAIRFVNNGLSSIAAVQMGITNSTKTANYTIVALDVGTRFNNSGAGGVVTNTLPAALSGMEVMGHVITAQTLCFKANGSEQIRLRGTSSTNGEIYNGTAGSSIRLSCIISGTWDATEIVETLVTGLWVLN